MTIETTRKAIATPCDIATLDATEIVATHESGSPPIHCTIAQFMADHGACFDSLHMERIKRLIAAQFAKRERITLATHDGNFVLMQT